ncbi:alpha/beta hydrolase [Benzoatithermus flavus]|uniref:Alpha/beta hydrolase n=1 Tax=Benzoatithermus flavus TaxID=3108223 RepID=A0ABU8XWW2_9PROT
MFDHIARRNGRGDNPSRLLEAWMPNPPLELLDSLAYGPRPRQRLDLYLPHDPRARRRLVVFLYGGGWDAGARRTYRFIAHMMVACGFAVAVPDYRLFPEARFPDFLEDTASALGWLYRNALDFGVDSSRMTLIGHSAGAYNAVVAALDPAYLERAGVPPSALRGVVGLAGPYAFNPLDYEETREIFATARHDPTRVQPVRLVRRHVPPMLLAHGMRDQRVLPINSLKLAEALRETGNEATAKLYPRHGHVGILLAMANPFRRVFRVLSDTVAFLDRVLGRPG